MSPKSKYINRRKMNTHSTCVYRPISNISPWLNDPSFNDYFHSNVIPFNQNGIANNTYPWPNQPVWNHGNINHNHPAVNQISYIPPLNNGMVQNGQMNNNVYYSNGPVYNGIQGFNTPNHNRNIFQNQNQTSRNIHHKQGYVNNVKSSTELPANQDVNSYITTVADVKEEIDKPVPEITTEINTLVVENSPLLRNKRTMKSKHYKRRKLVNTHIYFNDDEEVINAKPASELPANRDGTSCINSLKDVEEELASRIELDTESVPPKLEGNNIELFSTSYEDDKEKVAGAVVQYSEVKNNPVLSKYYKMRFALFSKFDEGIQLDEESWYSVTPEKLAVRTARRCRGDVIVDGFCGAGGNSIQFAFFAKKVIAIDIDPVKIALAKNNARVYGVEDRIEFICGNFLELAPTLQADVVFMSPPWGGPEYARQWVYDLEAQLLPVPFSKLMESARLISEDICTFLPRNSCRKQISQAANGVRLEIEDSYINDKSIGTTVYFNKLARFVARIDKPLIKNKSPMKRKKLI